MKLPRSFVAVAILAYAAMLVPVVLVVWMSFFEDASLTFPPDGYSAKWYTELRYQGQLMSGLAYSFQVALAATAVSLGASVAAALAAAKAPPGSRWASLAQDFFTLPLVVPAIISGIALYVYFYTLSIAAGVLLTESFFALLAAHVLITLPWTFRLVYAGLAAIEENLERASLDLGRDRLGTFLAVTFPLLRPSLVAAGIIAFIVSFENLEISLFLVAPGKTTLPVAMLDYVFFRVDPTIAAMSGVQMALIAALMLLANRFVGLSKAFD